MTRRAKTIATLVLSIAMILGILAGCGTTPTNTPAPTSGATPTTAEKSPFELGKFDPPITMTAVSRVGDPVYLYNDTLNDNAHTRWALDQFGIRIEYVLEPADADSYRTKLQLMISSNETLPDVVVYTQDPVTVGQLIESGKFMPIMETYEKYAGTEYKKHAEANPQIFYPFMKDGVAYGIPILEYAHNADTLMWIRKDWLDALSLDIPKTVDDLEVVLQKFKYENPDGFTPEEVFPFTFSFKNGAKTWLSTMDWFFGAYGTVPMQWNPMPDGSLAYGSIQPGAKDALLKLKDWMDKGYIPQDVATWDEFTATQIFVQGKAGVIGGGNWVMDWPCNGVKAEFPDAEVVPVGLIAGPDGKMGATMDITAANGVMLINKDFAHPEAYWMYYNYLLENYANPPVGGVFEYGFAQGYDWEIIDGVPTNDKTKLKENGIDYDYSYFNFLTMMPGNPARIPSSYFDALIKLADGLDPVTPFEKRMAVERSLETRMAAKVIMAEADKRTQNAFTGAPTVTMTEKWSLLFQAELETYTKMLYGQVDAAGFDAFVANWLKDGGEQVTKEVNDWYKSVTD